MTNERETLLAAALGHVPFEGMNDRAILAGAHDIHLSAGLARVYYPRGGASLAAEYHRRADEQLGAWLETTQLEGKFSEKIAHAVWHRLTLVDPELVRAGAAVLALPQNTVLGAQLIWETADTIWLGLGDNSTDFNWYSKRATLSAVIGAAVLFWLGDNSAGKSDTREFINRRIDGVMQFEKLKSSIRKVPGVDFVSDIAFGWVHAPRDRNLPGKTK